MPQEQNCISLHRVTHPECTSCHCLFQNWQFLSKQSVQGVSFFVHYMCEVSKVYLTMCCIGIAFNYYNKYMVGRIYSYTYRKQIDDRQIERQINRYMNGWMDRQNIFPRFHNTAPNDLRVSHQVLPPKVQSISQQWHTEEQTLTYGQLFIKLQHLFFSLSFLSSSLPFSLLLSSLSELPSSYLSLFLRLGLIYPRLAWTQYIIKNGLN